MTTASQGKMSTKSTSFATQCAVSRPAVGVVLPIAIGLVVMLTAFLAAPANAAECIEKIEAGKLEAAKFRLAAATIWFNSDTTANIGYFYFYDGKCECAVFAHGKRYTNTEVIGALKGPRGFRALIARLGKETMAQCPGEVDTGSPYMKCYRKETPLCRGVAG